MTSRRWTTVMVAAGVLASLTLAASPAATALPNSKGPAAAPHTYVVKGDLSAISCATRNFCLAVDATPSGHWAYVRITNHGASTHVVTAKRSQTPVLVSCPSAAGCAVLAATYPSYKNVLVPVSAHGALGAPIFISANNSNSLFNSISCYRTATHCTLVGQVNGMPNVATVIGSTVTAHQQAIPTNLLGASLGSVSCPTATKCYATGVGSVNGKELGLIVSIVNGVPTTRMLVKSASYTGLTAIACENATTCYALGSTIHRERIYTIRNGKVTASVLVPKGTELYGLACENAHLCDGVGSAQPKKSGNSLGAVLPIHSGKLGTVQKTRVTTLYAGGDNESTEPVSGFHNGLAIIGDAITVQRRSTLSIS
jgi:hypothetical protein